MAEKTKHLVIREKAGLFTRCGRRFKAGWQKAETKADCTCQRCLYVVEQLEAQKKAEHDFWATMTEEKAAKLGLLKREKNNGQA